MFSQPIGTRYRLLQQTGPTRLQQKIDQTQAIMVTTGRACSLILEACKSTINRDRKLTSMNSRTKKQFDRERETERQRETERETQRETQRETERDRQRSRRTKKRYSEGEPKRLTLSNGQEHIRQIVWKLSLCTERNRNTILSRSTQWSIHMMEKHPVHFESAEWRWLPTSFIAPYSRLWWDSWTAGHPPLENKDYFLYHCKMAWLR